MNSCSFSSCTVVKGVEKSTYTIQTWHWPLKKSDRFESIFQFLQRSCYRWQRWQKLVADVVCQLKIKSWKKNNFQSSTFSLELNSFCSRPSSSRFFKSFIKNVFFGNNWGRFPNELSITQDVKMQRFRVVIGTEELQDNHTHKCSIMPLNDEM